MSLPVSLYHLMLYRNMQALMKGRIKALGLKDIISCALLVRSTWYMRSPGSKKYKFLLALRYFLSCLKDGDCALAVKDGSQLHAFVILSFDNSKENIKSCAVRIILKILHSLLNLICLLLSKHSSDYLYDEKYKEQYALMHDIARSKNIQGCELVLIISDGSIKGLGCRLLKISERLALKSKHSCVYLLTDEGCNYTFYNRHNYNLSHTELLDFTVKGHESYFQKCFIYKKDL